MQAFPTHLIASTRLPVIVIFSLNGCVIAFALLVGAVSCSLMLSRYVPLRTVWWLMERPPRVRCQTLWPPQESLLYTSLLPRISSHGGISVLIPSIQLGFMVLDLAVTDSQPHAGKQTVATVAVTCRAHIHPLAVCVFLPAEAGFPDPVVSGLSPVRKCVRRLKGSISRAAWKDWWITKCWVFCVCVFMWYSCSELYVGVFSPHFYRHLISILHQRHISQLGLWDYSIVASK